ncbi:MAG: hypothetical protein LBH44_03065 [Treponema sp.]|jgi:hypothetical protein|nr:hypothetical protein [Treponema sp.]
MKCIHKLISIIALVAVIGITVAACGGGGGINPKSLAKETAALAVQLQNAEGDKANAIMKKMEELGKKFEKLSEADKKIFYEESERLANQ